MRCASACGVKVLFISVGKTLSSISGGQVNILLVSAAGFNSPLR